jgi:hypothetical protein
MIEQLFGTTAYFREKGLLGEERFEVQAFFLPRERPPDPLFFEREFFDESELEAAKKLSQPDEAALARLKDDPRQVALFHIAVMLRLVEGASAPVRSLGAIPERAREIVDDIEIPVTESPLSGKTVAALIAGVGGAAAAHVSVGQVLGLGAAFVLITGSGILVASIARPIGEAVGDQLSATIKRRLEKFLPSRRPRPQQGSSRGGGKSRTA